MGKTCQRNGCGKDFSDSNESCSYHPGTPVFHEGLKGWSCCTKKVTDFDDFLKIPGCTLGQHSDIKPDKPLSTKKASTVESGARKEVTVVDGVEVYSTKDSIFKAAPGSVPLGGLVRSEDQETPAPPKPKEQDLHDPVDAVIPIDTVCKRKSCGKSFTSEESKKETCQYHPGDPIFHEGSKGWTCCSRKVLEFDEFLKIKGCTTGQHRFLDALVTSNDDSLSSTSSAPVRECRSDFYQTPDKVILSIFAKKVDKTKSTIVFEEKYLKVDLFFLDGHVYTYHTELFQPIIPSESTYEILSTKIELNLKKANGFSWVSVEPPKQEIKSWTTFGTTGGVGTIGGKEAVVATDAPLHLLK